VIKTAVVGLGKMGLSHQAILNMHPEVELAAICDSSSYVLSVLKKYTGVAAHSDYEGMLRDVELDAVLIATPSRMHAGMVEAALERGLHVFCEKPFTLSPSDGVRLATIAREKGLVTQVGYHNHFVGAFHEVKRLIDAGAIGRVTHVIGEAYGPVVLKPKGGTWRSRPEEGGGSLYDYAAHPLDLLNWYLGEPVGVGGTVLGSVFSREIDDEVFGTLFYGDGATARISVNWSDESQRKMSTRITAFGTAGKIYADRQECQVYLRDTAPIPEGYRAGWNVRYTTELTEPVSFYLRGEEYTAQIDHFVARAAAGRIDGENTFESAAATDRVIAMLIADAWKGPTTSADREVAEPKRARRARLLRFPRLQPQPTGTLSQLESGKGA
jgi:predicted dehydrogenase